MGQEPAGSSQISQPSPGSPPSPCVSGLTPGSHSRHLESTGDSLDAWRDKEWAEKRPMGVRGL